ncbi:MAG: S4 domain-containing protein [Erythrobacter sp.]
MNGKSPAGSIRIDRLLVYLRFARTRSAALVLIETNALRCNKKHVLRGSEQVRIGDVLTIIVKGRVQVIQILALPKRRGSAELARSHYREFDGTELDHKGQMRISGGLPDETEDFS